MSQAFGSLFSTSAGVSCRTYWVTDLSFNRFLHLAFTAEAGNHGEHGNFRAPRQLKVDSRLFEPCALSFSKG